MNKVFSVIGGDIRFVRVAQRLAEQGFLVFTAGLGDNLQEAEKLKICSAEYAVKNSDYIILPLPATTDNQYINAPDSTVKIPLETIISNLKAEQIVFGGKLSPYITEQIVASKAKAEDYLEREDFAIQNAIPTAEGAISIAMQEMSRTIYQSRCLVTGYGRIAKILARYLQSLGAFVTIAARKTSDMVWAKAQGHYAIHTKDILKNGQRYDLIFNTVPSMLFDSEKLNCIDNNCTIIDLASKPGGVDFTAASELGLKVIWALSLPGKVAPISAGDIIHNTIMTIISERS